MSTVNEALNDIVNGDSGKTAVEMFDDLGQTIIAYSFNIIKRMRDTQVGMVKEEKAFLDEAQYQLEIINKVISKMRKAGRLPKDQPNDRFDEQLREKIKKEISRPQPQSSVAPIVTMIPQNEPEKQKKTK